MTANRAPVTYNYHLTIEHLSPTDGSRVAPTLVRSHAIRLKPSSSISSRNLLTRGVAGGWQLTGIIRRQSGHALGATAGADRSQTSLGTDRATQIFTSVYGGGSCAKVATACVNYLNATSFVTVPTNTTVPLGTFGIIRRVSRKPSHELRQI